MKKTSLLIVLPLLGLAALAAPPLLHAGAGSLTIVKFEADWCGPCQQMKPVFEKTLKGYPDVASKTVNVDKQSALADQYKVVSLPTVVALRDGKEVGRSTGFMNAGKLRGFIRKHR